MANEQKMKNKLDLFWGGKKSGLGDQNGISQVL